MNVDINAGKRNGGKSTFRLIREEVRENGEIVLEKLKDVRSKAMVDIKKDPIIASIVSESVKNSAVKRLVSKSGLYRAEVEKMRAERDSVTDGMTGLYNKRYFQEMGAEIIELVMRNKQDCSILVFDGDNFKEVNDKYGHAVGDRVLIDIAHRIKNNVRGSDVVCRVGGEEFAVILPNTDLETAASVAEKIRKAVEDEKVGGLNKTVSVGCASLAQILQNGNNREDGREKLESLFQKGDEALYGAKNSGRNKVVVCGNERKESQLSFVA